MDENLIHPDDIAREMQIRSIRLMLPFLKDMIDIFAEIQAQYIKSLVAHGLSRPEAIFLASSFHPVASFIKGIGPGQNQEEGHDRNT